MNQVVCKAAALPLLGAGAFMLSSGAVASEALSLAELQEKVEQQGIANDRLFIMIAGAMVFLMQAGFLCFEVGVVRAKNATAMALKNLIDWIVLSLAFFMVGFGLMFGESLGGVIGGTGFFGSILTDENGSSLGAIFFMFQLAFAGTALTIVSGAMSERTAFIPYLVGSIFMGLLIYPVFGHWAWGNLFYADNTAWLADMGFMDFAGSTVVHSVGAWVGLVGAIMVGARIGRYDAKGKMAEFKPSNYALTALGVVILWFGWWAFNGGSTLTMDDTVGPIILNTNIAGAAAGFAAFFHCFFVQKRDGIYEKIAGGILGGLVAITACCNVVTPVGALFVGLSAGVIHNYGYDLILQKWRIDDPVGAIPVHGVCGVWGTLCVAIFGQQEALALPRFEQLSIQVLGVLVCMVWTASMAYLMYMILKSTVGLRVSPDVEQKGIRVHNEFEFEKEALDDNMAELLRAKLEAAAKK